MEIITLSNREKWSKFLKANPGAAGLEFLASFEWAEVARREGKTVLPLAVVDTAGDIQAFFCLLQEQLPFGFSYWYAPRSPIFKTGIFDKQAAEITRAIVLKLRRDFPKAVFLKIEPAQNNFKFLKERASYLPGIKIFLAPDIQPRKTWILDLKKSAGDLLAEMHQKTRYNIRLAEKKGIKIIAGTAADFEEFWRLMSLTGERDGFRIHGQKHYQNLLASPADFIKIFFAEYEGQKIAAALVCYFGSQATYLHGASDNKFRNVMAPYLLQWEIIKSAQAAGALVYDFYGIDEKKWPGVTRFKLGFGGEAREYLGVYDLVLRPGLYSLYKVLKKIKRFLK